MKKFLRALPILVLLFMAVPHAYANITQACYPAVQCDSGEDYYGSSCKIRLESVAGPATPSCATNHEGVGNLPMGYSWAFDCVNGCYHSLVPICATSTANTNSTLPCCPNGQMPVKDAASASGWKCSTNFQVISGNVGIGSVTPASKLVVYDGNESTTLTDFTQSISKAGILISTDYTLNAYTPGVFWQVTNDFPTKPKAGIWLKEDTGGTDMYFGTSNLYSTGITNTALVIDQAGDVGIGTIDPSLGGKVSSRFTIVDGGTGLAVGTSSTQPSFALNPQPDGSWQMFDYAAGSWTQSLTSKNGNIGIKDDTPEADLNITHDIDTQGISIISESGSGNTHLPFSDNWNYIAGEGVIFRNKSNTEGMRFDADTKRLGINDTTPDYTLDVVGDANVDGVLNADSIVVNASASNGVYAFGTNNGGVFKNTDGQSLVEIGKTGGIGAYIAGDNVGAQIGCGTSGCLGLEVNTYGLNDVDLGGTNYAMDAGGPIIVDDSGCGAFCVLAHFTGHLQDSPYTEHYVKIFGDGWLDISGGAHKPGGGAWLASSDARLKNVGSEYDKGLDEIVALNPVNFHYKEDNVRGYDSSVAYVGLVAQDVQPIFPESVSESSDGYLELDTNPISFALINAIKELKVENDALKAVVCEIKPEATVCAQ